MNNLLIKKSHGLAKKKKKGFTLVELVIVIAIIAILAAIAIPKFGQIRENSNEKADMATARNIATIVAEGITDGSISASGTVDGNDTLVSPKLDGNYKPKALAANSAGAYYYDIDASTGNITIYYGNAKGSATSEVYPNYSATKSSSDAK